MADVASSVKASSRINTTTGIFMVMDSSETGMISPTVKEALDQIVPRSASQLFQMKSSDDCNITAKNIFHQEENLDMHRHKASIQDSGKKRKDPKVICEVSVKGQDREQDSNGKNLKRLSISRADLEIISASLPLDSDDHETRRSSRNGNLSNSVSSVDCRSIEHSDSDDMTRPFQGLTKERLSKKKRKKRKTEGDELLNNKQDSEDEFQINCKRKTRNEMNLSEKNLTNRSILNIMEEEYLHRKMNNLSQDSEGIKSKDLDVDMGGKHYCSWQKLPKPKKSVYHVKRDKKSIRNTFLPCQIVLKKSDSNQASTVDHNSVLPLSVRLKCLNDVCTKGLIKCRRRKKELRLKHDERESHLGHSEEEFEITRGRGRSLRKRNQNINYTEPSEFDIFGESHRKPRSKSKYESNGDSSQEESSKKISKSKGEKSNITTTSVVEDDITTVIAYPKTRVVNTTSRSYITTPGFSVPSSHTTLSSTSTITTLPNISVAPTMNSLLAPNAANRLPVSNTIVSPTIQGNRPPQYCMMKMNGKDVLMQLVPPSGNMQNMVLPSSGGTRIPLYPGVNLTTPAVGLSSGGLNIPPRMIHQQGIQVASVTGKTTSMNTSLPAGTFFRLGQTGALSNLPVIPMSQLSSISRPGVAPLIPGSVMRAPVRLATMSTSSGNLSSMSVTPVTQAVHSSSTSTRLTNANISQTSVLASSTVSNTSSSLRHVRVFVPGCVATGTRGHFTTLSMQANSNPLTRLTPSSQLLPQRKRPHEQLTPEQRAAKRRRLEKKYPLPPGVVIKTEPLEPHPAPTTTAVRSLLRQGCIQVIPGSRSGVGQMQSIRIVSPSLAASLQSRFTRPQGGNMVYQARGTLGGHKVFVPMGSSSNLTTSTPKNTVVTSGNVVLVSPPAAVSLLSSTRAIASTITTTATVSSLANTIFSTTTTASSQKDRTVSTQSGDSEIGTNGSAAEEMSALSGQTAESEGSSGDGAGEKGSSSEVESSNGPEPNPSRPTDTSSGMAIQTVQSHIDKLKRLIAAQESCGLSDERLEKLKAVLKEKQAALATLQEPEQLGITKESAEQISNVSGNTEDNNVSGSDVLSACDLSHTGSEQDPFVID